MSHITPGATQQLAPTDPLATAIETHKLALAAYLAAQERSWRLIEAIDPDMDCDDLEQVQVKMTAHFGAAAPDEIDKLQTARKVSSTAGDVEDETRDRLEAVPLTSAARIAAYVAYAKKHAASGKGVEAMTLWQALDHLGALLAERLAV